MASTPVAAFLACRYLQTKYIFLPAIYFQQQARFCKLTEPIASIVVVQDKGRQVHVFVDHILTAGSILQVC